MNKTRMIKKGLLYLSFTLSPVASCLDEAVTDVGNSAGKKQFNKCVACHSLEAGVHLMGPSLSGIFGRKAGSAEGFTYSPAMENSKVIWNRETLSLFLDSPNDFMPGMVMPFSGIRKKEQRDNLIDFLLTASQ